MSLKFKLVRKDSVNCKQRSVLCSLNETAQSSNATSIMSKLSWNLWATLPRSRRTVSWIVLKLLCWISIHLLESFESCKHVPYLSWFTNWAYWCWRTSDMSSIRIFSVLKCAELENLRDFVRHCMLHSASWVLYPRTSDPCRDLQIGSFGWDRFLEH